MHTFTATAHQEGTWRIIDIPELGQTTQARNAAAIQATAMDLAAVILDVDPSEVSVTVSMQTPQPVNRPCQSHDQTSGDV